jgi:hypothetical protein
MGAVRSGDGESQISKQAPGDVENRVVKHG